MLVVLDLKAVLLHHSSENYGGKRCSQGEQGILFDS